MKIKYTSFLIVLLFITCSKENLTNEQQRADSQNNLSATDTTYTPLDDLKKNTFMGDTGGLYPHGVNHPTDQYAQDLMDVSTSIVPLDTFGTSRKHGKIVFLSLGGSTGGHNMVQLKSQTVNNTLTNPSLLLLDGNNGYRQASLNSIMNPTDIYWDHVTQIITGAGSSYRQVQVIYLETDDSARNIGWPKRPNLIKKDLEASLRVFKEKFPNIKVVYVLARTRTFGNQIIYNREPSPYYFGWGCKWAIEDQINGVPGTKYKGKKAVAPMLTWGFYQWADSLPRKTDGFYWRSYETKDGLHATDVGEDTLATRFQNFLLSDRFASTWYAAH